MRQLPPDWSTATLADHLKRSATYGVVKAGKFVANGVPMVRGGDIKGGAIGLDLPQISQSKDAEYSRTRLLSGDVLVALVGYPGESAIVPKWLVGGNISRAVGLLRLSGGVLPAYLVQFLNSTAGRAEFLRPGAGSAQMVVNLKDLNKLEVPLPPTEHEQAAIAEALSDADGAIEGLERLIAKKRLFKKGAMQDLLTARRRLPGFSGKWRSAQIGELGQVKTGLTYSPDNVAPYGTLVLRSSNIQNERLAFENNVFVDLQVSDESTVRKGDLLICVRNGSRQLIGKTAQISAHADGMAFGAFMSAFRSDLNDYLIWCFQSSLIQRQVEENLGATINQITNKTLKTMTVPIPQDEAERKAICAVVGDMDAEITTLEARLNKARMVKEGMMQNLLTGRVRLV